ncbi:hypothetical protein IWT25_00716 [Secundilactobacillus pentosiphilus]|uniref:Uncharacterized protein n=1 Tax=Secundilactobacillus pentosiphilus TaxID=1714682 RepID=A0A1Z5IUZ9_9LACO|nr:hypothetical protein [Secundilactobacillus pentosiphilus]GAX05412.1 hypothetical protein IWT25_00716 [Secundilactobacillus pentosiphilus]
MNLTLGSEMIYTAPKSHKKRTPTRQLEFKPELLALQNIFQINSTPNSDLSQSLGGFKNGK